MNRITANRLLLLVALAHFLTDAGFAGAAVFCIGPDEHRAIESEHAADLGCSSKTSNETSAQEVHDVSTAAPLPGACVDFQLHPDGELASSQARGLDSPQALAIAPIGIRPSTSRESCTRPHARAPDETAAYRAVRTTVLII